MLSLLKELCHPFGVSGDEQTAAATVAALLSSLGLVEISPLGSINCRIPPKKEGLPRVMLTAHLDRIGMMAVRVTDKGFVRVAPCGGVDRRVLAGSRVTIHTASGAVAGVVCSVPPHLADGNKKCLKVEDCAVDIGLIDRNSCEIIGYGDRITFDGDLVPLLGNRVMSAALDNRAGCAAIIHAARLLADCDTAELSISLCSQEETGGGGAKTSTFLLAPDYAFVVDVSMAHTPDDKEELCGTLQGGPMIGYSPILSRELSQALAKTADANHIPFQQEVMGGRTGTDADAVAVSGGGVKTALISIPLKFMHTPCEIASLTDIENTAKLIALQVGGGNLC